MSRLSDLQSLAKKLGVHLEYHAWSGELQTANEDTLTALLTALGVDVSSDAAISEAAVEHEQAQNTRHIPLDWIAYAGQPFSVPVGAAGEWSLQDEAGNELQSGRFDGSIDLQIVPVGYYQLCIQGQGFSETMLVLARPLAAPSVPDLIGRDRVWGVTGALYGLRSAGNGGLGTYRDLSTAAQALGKRGAQYFGVNPKHAIGWAATDIRSPYSPSHRGFLNIDHIAVERDLAAPSDPDSIDYAEYRGKQRQVLEKEFKTFKKSGSKAFKDFCAEQGEDLTQFARFETLSETHGDDFRKWPEKLRRPGGSKPEARDEFHKWLQWRADAQLGQACADAIDAGMSLGLYLDLAVGARPGGAEAWINSDSVAQGVSVGAPPDHLAPAGQSWDLAAYAPNKLRAVGYKPFRSMVSKLMSKAGVVRIDHVLGLMRSFWVPEDGSVGAYITQPFDTLLAIISIEAWTHQTAVIGEDLGLVPDGFREKLNGSGLYSYAVWQFENYADGALRSVEELRPFSMACFSTHDTPTIAGFWRGRDIEWWKEIGWLSSGRAEASHSHRAHQRNSVRGLCGIAPDATLSDIRSAIHYKLGQSPAVFTTLQLDDILGVEEAQNLPGTIEEHPNWQRRSPVAVEDFEQSQEIREVGDLMKDRSAD